MEQKTLVNIEIWTPYLVEKAAEKYGKDFEQKQIEKFGYDPKNIIVEDNIITDRNIVLIQRKGTSPKRPHFVIAGSTQDTEATVETFKGTGLLVARYSIFYGEASDYTHNYPQESGYVFDIPKKTDIVKALLRCDDFLEAIVAREESKIRSAVDKFNGTIERPVLITDYLAQALRYG